MRRFAHPLFWLFVVALCIAMSALQLWRADVKGRRFAAEEAARVAHPIDLSVAHRDAAELIGRAVAARGDWLPDASLLLDNKLDQGQVGYHLVTPMRLAGSQAVVLVNRGWVRAPRLRSELPVMPPPPTGTVEVAGIARGFETRAFEFGDDKPQGRVWQHLREATYCRESGFDALPLVVLQTSAADDGLRRGWTVAGKPDPAYAHYGYAGMWAVFAVLAAGYAVMLRRPRNTPPPSDLPPAAHA